MAAIDQLAIHFAMDSNLLHKESDEAQRQLDKAVGSDQSDGSDNEDEDEGEKEEVWNIEIHLIKVYDC